MNRYFIGTTVAAVTTTCLCTLPSAASAFTLSQQASDLAGLTPDDANYWVAYDSVSDVYQGQAADYSLGFADWLAINSFVNKERAAYGTDGASLSELKALDLNSLTWEAGAQDVEVFFINEGAGYKNQFGYSMAAPESNNLRSFWNNDVNVIWENASSQNSILANGGPLALGQGYRLGEVAAGETVNFFLRNPYDYVFDGLSAEDTLNGDGLQHVTTYQYRDYLVLAYEDIYGGGDQDYNDVVIAVKGLADTETTDVPEPASALALLGIGLMGMVVSRRQTAHQA